MMELPPERYVLTENLPMSWLLVYSLIAAQNNLNFLIYFRVIYSMLMLDSTFCLYRFEPTSISIVLEV